MWHGELLYTVIPLLVQGYNPWSIHNSKIPKALKTHLTAKPDLTRNNLMIKHNLGQCETLILNPPVWLSICFAPEILQYLITSYCPRPSWECHVNVTVYAPSPIAFQKFWRILNSETHLVPRVWIWDNGPVLICIFLSSNGKKEEVNAVALGLEKHWNLSKCSEMVMFLPPD